MRWSLAQTSNAGGPYTVSHYALAHRLRREGGGKGARSAPPATQPFRVRAPRAAPSPLSRPTLKARLIVVSQTDPGDAPPSYITRLPRRNPQDAQWPWQELHSQYVGIASWFRRRGRAGGIGARGRRERVRYKMLK
jgi:hypothetical protein